MPSLDHSPATVRTCSPRALAGSRANKRRPVARESRFSDYDPETREYLSDPCMTAFNALAARGVRVRREGGKPYHPFRAVNLAQVVDRPLGGPDPRGEKAFVAGLAGRFAAPMTMQARLDRYVTQRGAPSPRQYRRLWKKARSVGEAL